jgi:hypothetical protein
MTTEEKELFVKASAALANLSGAVGPNIALQINKLIRAFEKTGKPNRFDNSEGNPLEHLVQKEHTLSKKPLSLKEAAAKREENKNVLATSEKKGTTRKK